MKQLEGLNEVEKKEARDWHEEWEKQERGFSQPIPNPRNYQVNFRLDEETYGNTYGKRYAKLRFLIDLINGGAAYRNATSSYMVVSSSPSAANICSHLQNPLIKDFDSLSVIEVKICNHDEF